MIEENNVLDNTYFLKNFPPLLDIINDSRFCETYTPSSLTSKQPADNLGKWH